MYTKECFSCSTGHVPLEVIQSPSGEVDAACYSCARILVHDHGYVRILRETSVTEARLLACETNRSNLLFALRQLLDTLRGEHDRRMSDSGGTHDDTCAFCYAERTIARVTS